jgi:hypothetical protein
MRKCGLTHTCTKPTTPPSNNPDRVLTADDHEILRAGIVSVLSVMAEITIAAEANTAETAGALFEQSPTNSNRQ